MRVISIAWPIVPTRLSESMAPEKVTDLLSSSYDMKGASSFVTLTLYSSRPYVPIIAFGRFHLML